MFRGPNDQWLRIADNSKALHIAQSGTEVDEEWGRPYAVRLYPLHGLVWAGSSAIILNGELNAIHGGNQAVSAGLIVQVTREEEETISVHFKGHVIVSTCAPSEELI